MSLPVSCSPRPTASRAFWALGHPADDPNFSAIRLGTGGGGQDVRRGPPGCWKSARAPCAAWRAGQRRPPTPRAGHGSNEGPDCILAAFELGALGGKGVRTRSVRRSRSGNGDAAAVRDRLRDLRSRVSPAALESQQSGVAGRAITRGCEQSLGFRAEVFRAAIAEAAAYILVHNHLQWRSAPSAEDRAAPGSWYRLPAAGSAVYDKLIIAGDRLCAFSSDSVTGT